MKRTICFLMAAMVCMAGPLFAGTVELPQTGQTTCYDQYGNVISCAGTGQDGEIQAGIAWPSPRFTVNAETVVDNLTGLVWAQDGNIMTTKDPGYDYDGTRNDGAVTFQRALEYVAKLNNEGYLGQSDWRLPNLNEMESLINANEPHNETWLNSQGFINAGHGSYWSSTSDAYDTGRSWVVDMGDNNGYVDDWGDKPGSNLVWPVRSGECDNAAICLPKTGQTTCYDTTGEVIPCSGTGQDGDTQVGVPLPSPRFTDNGDTVTDNLTSLIWTKNANVPGDHKTWKEALDYVQGMNAGTNPNFGHNDWRLPNRKELYSLVDHTQYNPALPTGHPFTNVQLGSYWSSTTDAQHTSDAWYVYFPYGWVGFTSKTLSYDPNFVWPVRAGQAAPSGCSTWTDVINKYTAYVTGQATWTDVINCYGEYAS